MHLNQPFIGSDVLRGTLLILTAVLLAQVAHYLLFLLLNNVKRWWQNVFIKGLTRYTNRSLRFFLTLLALSIATSRLGLSLGATSVTDHVFEVSYILAITWITIGCVEVLHFVVVSKLPEEVQNNIPARRLRTQVNLLRQIVIGLAFFLGSTALLMTFPAIRALGTGLFASAGVAGLVLGIAARPTLSNLIAGIQIAVTESIRIGDAVVVEGEFGRVVEVNTTNVVICLWDLRHLIVPVSYFIEKPFQNWTRYSSDLIGAVHLQMDYMVQVERLRSQYTLVLEASPLWDKKTILVQVTNAKEKTMEVRFLMSAATAADTFNLRCYIREAMLAYLRENYPAALPRLRSEVAITRPLDEADYTTSDTQR